MFFRRLTRNLLPYVNSPASPLRNAWEGLRDLWRGLFSLSTQDAPSQCDYAGLLEERYSKPRRCC